MIAASGSRRLGFQGLYPGPIPWILTLSRLRFPHPSAIIITCGIKIREGSGRLLRHGGAGITDVPEGVRAELPGHRSALENVNRLEMELPGSGCMPPKI